MSTEGIFYIVLATATFLTSLVAGLLFIFAVVVMPGIKTLNDREFIRAFQVIDGVIQNNQPLFMLVWGGSVVTMVASVVFGFGQLAGIERTLLIDAALAYILGVQVPTVIVNLPLNNRIQTVDVDSANEVMQVTARTEFESRWNLWNTVRTAMACLASAQLILLLLIL